MNGLGLTAAQLEARRSYVQAGDAADIMAGNWIKVYRAKKGLAPGDDLARRERQQLGSYTEPFNLAWYAFKTGRAVVYFSGNPLMRAAWELMTGGETRTDELQVSAQHPWMACNLDALSTTSRGRPCVLDAKHVGQFRHDELVLRYLPGMVHQATVAGHDWWALSVLVGNGRHEVVEQEVDPFYQEALIAREREFWSWVERGVEPPDMLEPAAAPKPQPRLRHVAANAPFGTPEWGDLLRRENWLAECANEIAAFAETEGAAKAHAVAREKIRALVPDDVGTLVRRVRQGRFSLRRATNGSVTMVLSKGEGNEAGTE